MLSNKYKMCPLKKRPVVYKIETETNNNNYDHISHEPQDLSMKRKADEVLVNEPKRNFVLNLSTNSVYDQLRRLNPINWHVPLDNLPASLRPDSPVSNASDSSPILHRETSTSPSLPEYGGIHLRGLSQYQINQTELLINQSASSPPTTYWHQPTYSNNNEIFHHSHPYNLTPPSSPLSSSASPEPEDLSMKSYIPLPVLYNGLKYPCEQQQQQKLKESSSPRFKCDKCGKSYSTLTGLSKHQQFHCPAAECNQVKKIFGCKSCEKVYTSLGALKMHIRTHTLPCKCPICGKAFSRPWLLQGHIRTHTGEKPFTCGHCHRAFADRSNLRAHQQTHVDVKKYICEGCNKSFSRMSLLNKHLTGGCPLQKQHY